MRSTVKTNVIIVLVVAVAIGTLGGLLLNVPSAELPFPWSRLSAVEPSASSLEARVAHLEKRVDTLEQNLLESITQHNRQGAAQISINEDVMRSIGYLQQVDRTQRQMNDNFMVYLRKYP